MFALTLNLASRRKNPLAMIIEHHSQVWPFILFSVVHWSRFNIMVAKSLLSSIFMDLQVNTKSTFWCVATAYTNGTHWTVKFRIGPIKKATRTTNYEVVRY